MLSKHTNGGCGCASCRFTNGRTLSWGFTTPSDADIARYQNAKQFSKTPKDPLYTVHFNACHPIPQKPVARPKRGQPMFFRDHGTTIYKERREYPPHWERVTTKEYIRMFSVANTNAANVLDFTLQPQQQMAA